MQVYERRGVRYAYKVTRTYRNAKGRPTCDRRSIGRVDGETGMLVPNGFYYECYGAEGAGGRAPAAPSPAGPANVGEVREAGLCLAVSKALGACGAGAALEGALGGARAGRVEAVASYMLAEGNVLTYLGDFCSASTAPAALDDRRASELFPSLAPGARMAFFRAWVPPQAAGGGLVAYDVTSFSSYSEGMRDLERGCNRDGERLPQASMAMYTLMDDGTPLFYCTYPGSIVDKAHLPSMMRLNAELDVGAGTTFAMDRGFPSVENLKAMRELGLAFLMGAPLRGKAVRGALEGVRGSLRSSRNWLPGLGVHGAAVDGVFWGVRCRLFVYHDAERAADAQADLQRRLSADEEELSRMGRIDAAGARRYRKRGFRVDRAEDGSFACERDHDAVDAMTRDLGLFCLVGSDMGMGPERALEVYRRRGTVEKSFDDLKNHLDMRRMRTRSDAAAEGKMFCAFVGLVARARMWARLAGWARKGRLTFEGVARELRKVRAVRLSGGWRLANPLTKRRREILGLLSVDEAAACAFVEGWTEPV